ncbi:MAG: hypothetical protein KME32_00330 [Mojavia pulchra JT2-VF2]|jgi:hypothetical protein|uniref:Uncharacterized protein n=1 Tax=Mojavia pulchra JT2-VF2 TaxID=287848 RepID=A0A951PTJ9_9NOST|nr:hypothetical protein [Mojavia pulchra JT2-VF2]
MFYNLFREPNPKSPTPFERDIEALVQTLKEKVTEIYQKNPPDSCIGMWIYGTKLEIQNTLENQGMLIFKNSADLIVKKYSHSLKEGEPKNIDEVSEYLKQQANNNYSKSKNLAVEVNIWINDIQLASKSENLDEVLRVIESLEIRVSDFKKKKALDYFQ